MKQNLSALLATVALLSSLQAPCTSALQIQSSKLQEPAVLNQVNIDLEQASSSEENDSDEQAEPEQYTNDDESLDVQADDDDDDEQDDTQDDEDTEGDQDDQDDQDDDTMEDGEDENDELYLYANEDGGLAQFLIAADQTNVFGWNAATSGDQISLVSGLKKITSVAVDDINSLLFVADYDYDKDFGYVYQYDLQVDLSDEDYPQLQVNFTNSQQIYQNGKVKGISVYNGTVLIADTGASELATIEVYDIDSEALTLVEDDPSVSALSFCMLDEDGTIYWSEDNKGQQNGALLSLDSSDEDASPVVLIDGLDDIEQFVIDGNYLYFLSDSGSSVYGAYLNNPELLVTLAEDLDANSLSYLSGNLFIGTDQGILTIQDVNDIVQSGIQSNSGTTSIQENDDDSEEDTTQDSSESDNSSSSNNSNTTSTDSSDDSEETSSSSNSTSSSNSSSSSQQLAQTRFNQQQQQAQQDSSSSEDEDVSESQEDSSEDQEESDDPISISEFEGLQIYAMTSFTFDMTEESSGFRTAVSTLGLLALSMFTMTSSFY